MKKILVFSVLLLSAIAVTTGTTITTTIQIQPAYSQAQQCLTTPGILGQSISLCATPGKDPSTVRCLDGTCSDPRPIGGDNPQQQACQLIGQTHQICAHRPQTECTVIPS
jgi:hypothetical protein